MPEFEVVAYVRVNAESGDDAEECVRAVLQSDPEFEGVNVSGWRELRYHQPDKPKG